MASSGAIRPTAAPRLAIAGEDPSRVNAAAAFIVGGSACMIRSFGSDLAMSSGPSCGQGEDLDSAETADQTGTASCAGSRQEEGVMSTYKVIEVIGTSPVSWEEAAAQAVKTAGGTLHDLRVAEVVKQDIHVDEGGAITFRTKLELSFKYDHPH